MYSVGEGNIETNRVYKSELYPVNKNRTQALHD